MPVSLDAPTPKEPVQSREAGEKPQSEVSPLLAAPTGWWRAGALPLLALLLFLVVVLAGALGEVPISPTHTAEILLNQLHVFHFRRTWPLTDEVILLQLRLPRVAAAALVGVGLAVAGTLFQGVLRNPLADPLLLGTSAGAALGASVAFVVPAGMTLVSR